MPIDLDNDQLTDTQRSQARSRESQPSSRNAVSNIATYRTPMTASLNGRPVRIIATGDHPGSSPVCQYIDEDGKLNWERASKFTVVDTQFLPPSAETLEQVLNTFRRQ